MDRRIKIIGIGDEGPAGLSTAALKRIERADILAGGDRHLSLFPGHRGEAIRLKGGLGSIAGQLDALRADKDIVVLASGDPLFYGIAGFMVKKLGPDAVEVHPHVSSVQLAFARMGESWQDAVLESIHGRALKGLAQKVSGREKIALLTDHVNTPSAIAHYLIDFGITEYDAFVAENLGGEHERCRFRTLEEMSRSECSPLNIVILRRKPGFTSPQFGFGIEDEEFCQRKPEKGLITKKEVRILSLSELALRKDSVVWDIGAGCGSVAVECTLSAPCGQVFAIEKNAGDIENIERNRKKFRADFTVIHDKAPHGLEPLPDPDAVFIGGSGGELRELIRICCARLKAGGRIVVNAATIETLSECRQALTEHGFDSRITLVQISRSKPILDMTRFEGLNPIYVITGFAKHGK
ncbi:precorrin-6Y C5,15-methyltransferase (decarboxylating) [Paenibacillus forsythiae]|uniref:Precorrin-6Y C5,15-methyltransferase (Decarboxylating) n=1 Tax=Paenibacillus forsythiae TaxID=365616 RepID=A0ABU3HDM5_9BACL|nr:bifunctional cobalt-precorrin-7 (C(5))-methyltransferase/cobalt-precorrin-6B (C(15))-methyltransferase [Paenibacillus forsythiae]MDT3428920.1 precorrin-6Y C5,15-methyltransferase (decarboxylating) [Paenibacillus forsythiae]